MFTRVVNTIHANVKRSTELEVNRNIAIDREVNGAMRSEWSRVPRPTAAAAGTQTEPSKAVPASTPIATSPNHVSQAVKPL